MKYIALSLGLLALAGCNPQVPASETVVEQVEPKTVGIDFANMPVGTTAFYTSNNDYDWSEVYRGKEGRYHALDFLHDGEVEHTNLYHDDGTLYRRKYASGNVRTFSPKRCMRVLGDCEFVASNTKPRKRSSPSKGNLTKSGNWYTYVYGARDGSSKFTYKYQLGEFNLVSRGRIDSNQYTERLVKVVKP